MSPTVRVQLPYDMVQCGCPEAPVEQALQSQAPGAPCKVGQAETFIATCLANPKECPLSAYVGVQYLVQGCYLFWYAVGIYPPIRLPLGTSGCEFLKKYTLPDVSTRAIAGIYIYGLKGMCASTQLRGISSCIMQIVDNQLYVEVVIVVYMVQLSDYNYGGQTTAMQPCRPPCRGSHVDNYMTAVSCVMQTVYMSCRLSEGVMTRRLCHDTVADKDTELDELMITVTIILIVFRLQIQSTNTRHTYSRIFVLMS